jgi:hypothetical protein
MARKAPDKSAEELRAAIDTANRVSDDVKIVAMRRGKLKRCLTWRRLVTQEQRSAIDADPQFFIDRLKDEQIELLKLRIWRTTGQYPSQN